MICQAKGDTADSCPQNRVSQPRGDLVRSFIAMVQGWGCGWLIRIRVCAGPAFLESGLRWSPDEFLWFSRLTSCDLLSGMKTASSSIIVNIFHLLGVLVLQKSSKILLHVSLEAEPGSCPKAALLFLDCSSLFSVSPPFPD